MHLRTSTLSEEWEIVNSECGIIQNRNMPTVTNLVVSIRDYISTNTPHFEADIYQWKSFSKPL
jgi:hypothetical protein